MNEAANMQGTKVRIHECSSCGSVHEDITLAEYQKKIGPFTHWYACPTLGDPCQLALLTLHGDDGMELSGPICTSLVEAQLAGRYMVAIWWITPDAQIHLNRICKRFPNMDVFGDGGKCKGAFNMLRENLEQEFAATQQPAEIKPAAKPQPLRNLLGAATKLDNAQRIKIPMEAFKPAMPEEMPSNPDAVFQSEKANGADNQPSG